MKLQHNSLLALGTAAFVATAASSNAALVFSEDFGTLANGTTLTTSNTAFTYVRTSTGTGAEDPSAINPSNVATGASGYLESPSGSLTGVGVQNTLPTSSVYTFSVGFRFSDVTAGDIVFGLGSGTAFTGNGTFTTSQGLFWLQSDAGNFERRTSDWNDVGTGITFANATNYSLHVVANGSASAVNYGSETLAAGTMDIYLNGTLVDDGVAVTNSLSADGFRAYSINGTGVEIDNVSLWNSAEAIPEPTAALLGSFGLLGLLRRRR